MTKRALARHDRTNIDTAAITVDEGTPGLNVSALMRHTDLPLSRPGVSGHLLEWRADSAPSERPLLPHLVRNSIGS